MQQTTIIEAGTSSVEAEPADATVWLDPADLERTIGWQLKPEGLCRGEVCVPLGGSDAVGANGSTDLVAVARVLGRQVVVDTENAVVAVSLDAEARRHALVDRALPDIELPDLAGTPARLTGWPGKKKLLVAFASW